MHRVARGVSASPHLLVDAGQPVIACRLVLLRCSCCRSTLERISCGSADSCLIHFHSSSAAVLCKMLMLLVAGLQGRASILKHNDQSFEWHTQVY